MRAAGHEKGPTWVCRDPCPRLQLLPSLAQAGRRLSCYQFRCPVWRLDHQRLMVGSEHQHAHQQACWEQMQQCLQAQHCGQKTIAPWVALGEFWGPYAGCPLVDSPWRSCQPCLGACGLVCAGVAAEGGPLSLPGRHSLHLR